MSETLRTPDKFPEGNSNIILRGPAGDLEAVTHTAESDIVHPAIGQATAIICHGVIQNAAHMHNKVVMMMIFHLPLKRSMVSITGNSFFAISSFFSINIT